MSRLAACLIWRKLSLDVFKGYPWRTFYSQKDAEIHYPSAPVSHVWSTSTHSVSCNISLLLALQCLIVRIRFSFLFWLLVCTVPNKLVSSFGWSAWKCSKKYFLKALFRLDMYYNLYRVFPKRFLHAVFGIHLLSVPIHIYIYINNIMFILVSWKFSL